jgi:hypothetical protein
MILLVAWSSEEQVVRPMPQPSRKPDHSGAGPGQFD